MRVIYERHVSGNFHVSLPFIDQIISVSARRMKKILGVDPMTKVGCVDVTAKQLDELGFVIPSYWSKKSV